MPERPKFFDDLAGVAGGALSALNGLREELTALVRTRVEEAMRKLDLVKREDFEAMSELAQRAKSEVEALELRVAALEKASVPGYAAAPATAAAAPAETPAPALPELDVPGVLGEPTPE